MTMTTKEFDEIVLRDMEPDDYVPGVGTVQWVEDLPHRDTTLVKFVDRDNPVTYDRDDTFMGVKRDIPRPDHVTVGTRTNTITLSPDRDNPDTHVKMHVPAHPSTTKPAYGRVIKADDLIQALRDLGYLED